MYPKRETREAVPVNTVVKVGIANRRKYAICSANGWITAAKEESFMHYQHVICETVKREILYY